MNSSWKFLASALCVGTALGFLIGRQSSTRENPAAATTASPTRTLRPSGIHHDSSSRPRLPSHSPSDAASFAGEARKLQLPPPHTPTADLLLLFSRWAETDPRAAASYAASHLRHHRPAVASAIAGAWAEHDPDAAFAWASSLEIAPNPALAAVIRRLAETHPEHAVSLTSTLPLPEQKAARETLARQWGTTDFPQARAWAATLPAAEAENLLAQAIAGLSVIDPAAAAREHGSLPPGEASDRNVSTIAANWSLDDPQAAAAWAASRQSPAALRNGMQSVLPALVALSPEAALGFVNSLPPGPAYDHAMAAYIQADTLTPPAELFRLADTITDDAGKGLGMAAIMNRWERKDPQAAKAWLEQVSRAPAPSR